jgi:dihydroorotate dehydrogenase electron transfer subunit
MRSRPSDVPVEVVANLEIAPDYFSLRVRGPSRLSRFRPGQFLMLGWTDGLDPLLPRAMSIRGARTVPDRAAGGVTVGRSRRTGRAAGAAEVEILYKVVGRGTTLLATMRRGRRLRALGPLGNAFEVPRSARRALLVAGGIGVPPIVALAETLARRRGPEAVETIVFLGGKSKRDLLCIPEFRRAGAPVHLATEDGSAGFRGRVTEFLEEFLSAPHPARRAPRAERRSSHPAPNTVLYACGPHPMLARLSQIAEKHDLPYQASLEANMACGFGACMGCVVPALRGEGHRTYRLVCKDGPVFDGRGVLWT